MLLGSTELLDAARLAGLSSARDALADVEAAAAKVSPQSASPLRAFDVLATRGSPAPHDVDAEAHRQAWREVHLHAMRAAALLESLTAPTAAATADLSVAARRMGGYVDAQSAALQLRNVARQAVDPLGADLEALDAQLEVAGEGIGRAMRTSIWHHAAPNAGEVRVRFRDGDLQRMVGDGLSTGSAAEALAQRAHAAMADTQQWYAERFGHEGFDGARHDLDLVLDDDPASVYAEAERTTSGDGQIRTRGVAAIAGERLPGVRLESPAGDAGTLTHEYFHLVLADVLRRNAIDVGRLGPVQELLQDSVSEGLADVFQALRTRSWEVGGDLVLDAGAAGVAADGRRVVLRNVATSDDPAVVALRPLARSLQEGARMVRSGQTDPHVLGGMVSTAARRIQGRIGWQAMGDLMWKMVTDAGLRHGELDPKTWAAATMRTAERMWSGTSKGDKRIAEVRRALQDAGYPVT